MSKKISTKEIQAALVDTMKRWQVIEEASVASTGEILEKTENPLIRQVLEIIQTDSKRHRDVQQLIADLTAGGTVVFSIDDLNAVWDDLEKHIALERSMVAYVEEALEAIKGRKMLLQEYLLRYLHQDEKKHDSMLAALEEVKKGIYPYA